MTKNNQGQKLAYASVLQDLYAKRVYLNQAIEALEAVVAQEGYSRELATGRTRTAAKKGEAEKTGLTIIGAIKSLLRQSDRPLGNAEIFRKLKAAGVKFRSSNPQLSVSQVLSRNLKAADAPVRVGRGKWTMK